ncbi:MAG: hypothetical protein K6V97_03830 [Actinomycetia bacterium]|nr:hypothetical protein [Actinomycetes bacterium]
MWATNSASASLRALLAAEGAIFQVGQDGRIHVSLAGQAWTLTPDTVQWGANALGYTGTDWVLTATWSPLNATTASLSDPSLSIRVWLVNLMGRMLLVNGMNPHAGGFGGEPYTDFVQVDLINPQGGVLSVEQEGATWTLSVNGLSLMTTPYLVQLERQGMPPVVAQWGQQAQS